MSSVMHQLGETVRQEMGEGSDRAARALQRVRLVEHSQRPRPRRGTRWALGGAIAAAVAAGAVVGLQIGGESEFECTLNDGTPVRSEAWIGAPQSQPRQLQFSDGSTVDLGPDTRARLPRIHADQVDLILEGGTVQASIQSSRDRRWVFSAGPYQVKVTGTVLRIAWSPAPGQLAVDVERGSVEVRGGELADRTVAVVKGERLVVDQRTHRISLQGAGGESPDRSESPAVSPVESPLRFRSDDRSH